MKTSVVLALIALGTPASVADDECAISCDPCKDKQKQQCLLEQLCEYTVATDSCASKPAIHRVTIEDGDEKGGVLRKRLQALGCGSFYTQQDCRVARLNGVNNGECWWHNCDVDGNGGIPYCSETRDANSCRHSLTIAANWEQEGLDSIYARIDDSLSSKADWKVQGNQDDISMCGTVVWNAPDTDDILFMAGSAKNSQDYCENHAQGTEAANRKSLSAVGYTATYKKSTFTAPLTITYENLNYDGCNEVSFMLSNVGYGYNGLNVWRTADFRVEDSWFDDPSDIPAGTKTLEFGFECGGMKLATHSFPDGTFDNSVEVLEEADYIQMVDGDGWYRYGIPESDYDSRSADNPNLGLWWVPVTLRLTQDTATLSAAEFDYSDDGDAVPASLETGISVSNPFSPGETLYLHTKYGYRYHAFRTGFPYRAMTYGYSSADIMSGKIVTEGIDYISDYDGDAQSNNFGGAVRNMQIQEV